MLPTASLHGRTTIVGLIAVALLGTACGGGDSSEPEVLAEFGQAQPGDTVGLIAVDAADGTRTVEWASRRDGTIHRLDIDDSGSEIETVATVDVGIDGEQRGLLGQVLIDGRRYASWTTPDLELIVGEIGPSADPRIVWSAGESGSGAIGGVLQRDDASSILIGLGRNTGWDTETGIGGAILRLDPDAMPDQAEGVVSTGYTNPWAFRATDDGSAIWVADNAAGPDPDDESRDDVERIGRADIEPDRNEMDEIDEPARAPSAMIELPDGRLGICGFLDNELRAYDTIDTDRGRDTGLEPAEIVMPCNTGAAVFDDGTIVTAAQTDVGESLLILHP
ncbi:hypothetical protein [Ilumatobacter nonamiensis]|uniref:hypothetical protein n=1 Tax=Ilumatobacter nonamiensis TaxID=467093 RepID=UPI0011D1E6D7|nr:hypothetical protein [Ilumatobacter nonamiensis]